MSSPVGRNDKERYERYKDRDSVKDSRREHSGSHRHHSTRRDIDHGRFHDSGSGHRRHPREDHYDKMDRKRSKHRHDYDRRHSHRRSPRRVRDDSSDRWKDNHSRKRDESRRHDDYERRKMEKDDRNRSSHSHKSKKYGDDRKEREKKDKKEKPVTSSLEGKLGNDSGRLEEESGRWNELNVPEKVSTHQMQIEIVNLEEENHWEALAETQYAEEQRQAVVVVPEQRAPLQRPTRQRSPSLPSDWEENVSPRDRKWNLGLHSPGYYPTENYENLRNNSLLEYNYGVRYSSRSPSYDPVEEN